MRVVVGPPPGGEQGFGRGSALPLLSGPALVGWAAHLSELGARARPVQGLRARRPEVKLRQTSGLFVLGRLPPVVEGGPFGHWRCPQVEQVA